MNHKFLRNMLVIADVTGGQGGSLTQTAVVIVRSLEAGYPGLCPTSRARTNVSITSEAANQTSAAAWGCKA